MKKTVIFLLAIILNLGNLLAQSSNTITVPYGTPPKIDGILSKNEWADALYIQVRGSLGGDIYVKHTDSLLFVAFTEGGYASSGIYIDKLQNGGTAPQTDDLWLHSSAGKYEWYGDGTSWKETVPSGWSYIVNIESRANALGNEYVILFSKLGIKPNTTTTLGVLFSFMDWSSGGEVTWPVGGEDNCTDPSKWGKMIIQAK